MKNKKSNIKLLIILLGVGVGMLGLAYAFVPLYDMFCRLIGTPTVNLAVGRAGDPKPLGEISNRTVNVHFMANSNMEMPVELKAKDRQLKVHINDPVLTAYTAQNNSNEAIKGVAIHTIIATSSDGEVPDAASYVDLQQCFCFEEQIYPAGEEVTLPLSFHVAETLPETVHTITFGYTLYKAQK